MKQFFKQLFNKKTKIMEGKKVKLVIQVLRAPDNKEFLSVYDFMIG